MGEIYAHACARVGRNWAKIRKIVVTWKKTTAPRGKEISIVKLLPKRRAILKQSIDTKNESIASDLAILRRSILTGKPNTHFPCMLLVVSAWLVYLMLYRSGPLLCELACKALAVDLEPVRPRWEIYGQGDCHRNFAFQISWLCSLTCEARKNGEVSK